MRSNALSRFGCRNSCPIDVALGMRLGLQIPLTRRHAVPGGYRMEKDRRLLDGIELEVFLFGGVPERPNPVYGRDGYENVVSRNTRSTVDECSFPRRKIQQRESPEEPILQTFVINFEEGTIEFGEFRPEGAS